MKCTKCGNEVSNAMKFCKYCGIPIEKQVQQEIRCRQCGANVKEGHLFCTSCGTSVTSKTDKLQTNSNKEVRKRKSFGKVILFLLLVIVLGLVAVGVLYFKPWESEQDSNKKDEVVVEESNKSENKSEPVEDVGEDEIIDTTQTENREPEDVEQMEEIEDIQEDVDIVEDIPVDRGYIIDVYATSSLSEYDMTHSPNRVIDGDISTAWVEGVDGNGYGENIVFLFDESYMVSGFEIHAGYQKDSSRYYKNARPKEICVSFSDGTSQIFDLKDTMGSQRVELSFPVETSSVKITINSVYSGNTYQDTVISEIAFY